MGDHEIFVEAPREQGEQWQSQSRQHEERQGESWQRSLLEMMPAAVYTCDSQGLITYYNQYAAQLWGRQPKLADPADRYCGSWRLFYPDGAPLPHAETPMALAVHTGKRTRHQEVIIERPDGSRVHVSVSIDPIFDQDGRPCGAVNIFQDISAHKQAEVALRQSEERHRSLLELMPTAVFTCDSEGLITYYNQRAVELWGRRPKLHDPADRYSGAFRIYRPDGSLLPHDQGPMALAVHTGRSTRGEEIEILRPDGTTITASVNVDPLFDQTGRQVGAINVFEDITRRKRVEERLRVIYQLSEAVNRAEAVEQIYELALSGLERVLHVDRASILLFDPAGVMRFQAAHGLSAAYRRRVEGHSPWSPDETQPQPILVPDVAGADLGALQQTILDEGIRAMAFIPLVEQDRLLGKFMLYYNQPHSFTEEEVEWAEAIARHVAHTLQRKRGEEALRRQSELTQTVLENSTACLFMMDARGYCIYMNSAGEQMFGWTFEEIRQKPLHEMIHHHHPDGRPYPMSECPIDRALPENFDIREHEDWFIRKNGEFFPVLVAASPIFDHTGRPISTVIEVRDVTERMQTEARIRSYTQTLEALNQVQLSLAAELDLQKLLQLVTDASTELSGAEFGAFFYNVTTPSGDAYMLYTLSGVPREAFAHFPMPRATSLFGATFRGEGVIRLADVTEDPRYGKNPPYRGLPPGHLPICSYLAVPVISRSGEVIGGLFMGHSQPGVFTEQAEQLVRGIATQAAVTIENARLYSQVKDSEEALLELNANLEQRVGERTAELERSNRELDQFAYIASHDLKAPLRAIEQLASWIAEDAAEQLPSASQEHLAKLQGRIKRMERLLEDLLLYSRVGRQRHTPEEVNVAALIHNVVEMLTPPSGFDIRVSATLPAFIAEAIPLETVLRNLIGNAIKHHHCPTEGRVRITAQERGRFVEFAVSDNGPGVDPALHQRMFEMFQTLRPRDEVEGSGIGLALVKKLVENRGGRVWVESKVGQGTTFYFTWPTHSTNGNTP